MIGLTTRRFSVIVLLRTDDWSRMEGKLRGGGEKPIEYEGAAL